MPVQAAPKPIPVCPRCGYDQSGGVAAWTDRCPVEGRCPECGTGFGWADLFDPSRQRLGWYAEHAGSCWGALRRSLSTVAYAVLPWVFWARVRVQSEARPGRLGAWLVLWIVGVHLLTALPVGLFLLAAGYSGESGWRGVMELVRHADRFSLSLWGVHAVNAVTWPFYSLQPGLSWIYIVDADAENAIPYLSPLWVGVCWALLLLILPTTRRLARLRPAHLWRAVCVQWAVVLAWLAVARVAGAAYEQFWNEWLLWLAGIIPIALHVWSVLWWACAIRVGWSIRSWWLLVLGFVVVYLSMLFVVAGAVILADL